MALLLPGREQDYVGFLEVRKTPITPLTNPEIKVSEQEVDSFAAKVRKQAIADREVFQLSQRAFVSWARSYIEHKATSIFRITDVDWVDTAKGWGLVTLPKMPELKGSGIDRSLGHGIDVESIPFKDKAKEKKRQEELAQAEEDRKNGVLSAKAAALAAKRKKNEAWSGRQGQEDTRVERRERKQRKREAVKVSKMTDEEKAEQKRLEDMIAEVRRRNQEAAALASKDEGDDDGFEGFD